MQKQQEQQQQPPQKKGKFFEFIKKIDTLDSQPEAAKVKSDYDMDDLDISFDKISKTPSPAGSALTGDKEVGASSEGG